MRFDLFLFEKIKNFRRHFQTLFHATRKDYNLRAVVEQLLNVGHLDPGNMTGTGFAPVPFTGTAREKFCILKGFTMEVSLASERAVADSVLSEISRSNLLADRKN